jgi:hypothetical protein
MPYGTINADKFTTSDNVTSSGLYGFKNRIINGAMVIDQRNAGAAVTFNDAIFVVDRFGSACSQSAKATAQRSTTAPAGFTNSILITSSSAYSVTATDFFNLYQNIEGFNATDFGWGTANAQTVTLSFWVRSSLTGTFGGSLSNAGLSRSYPFTYTINAANTFEYKTITIAGDTTGTWQTDNGIGLRVYFGLGVGSTYSGTAGAWAGTRFQSATGATSVVGTNGATFYITGVQLEKGSTATSFDYRPYGTELALCQRYYQNIGGQTLTGFAEGTTNLAVAIFFYQQMRAAPTCSIRSGNTLSVRSPGGDYNAASPVLANTTTGTNAIWTNISGFSGLTVNAVVTSRLTNQDAIAASAEL